MLNEKRFGVIQKGYKIEPVNDIPLIEPNYVADWRDFTGDAVDGDLVAGLGPDTSTTDATSFVKVGLLKNIVTSDVDPNMIEPGVLLMRVGARFGYPLFVPLLLNESSGISFKYQLPNGTTVRVVSAAAGTDKLKAIDALLSKPQIAENLYVLTLNPKDGEYPMTVTNLPNVGDDVQTVSVVKLVNSGSVMLSLPKDPNKVGLVGIHETTAGTIIDTTKEVYNIDYNGTFWTINPVGVHDAYTGGYAKLFITDQDPSAGASIPVLDGVSVYYRAIFISPASAIASITL